MAALATSSSMSRACSLSHSGCLDAKHLPSISPVAPRRPMLLQRRPGARRNSKAVRVCAQQQEPKGLVATVRDSTTRFLQRYDPVTTGIGSLLVTGYCVVVHQQSVGEALNIAACATVLGMVAQEVLFNGDEAKNEV